MRYLIEIEVTTEPVHPGDTAQPTERDILLTLANAINPEKRIYEGYWLKISTTAVIKKN